MKRFTIYMYLQMIIVVLSVLSGINICVCIYNIINHDNYSGIVVSSLLFVSIVVMDCFFVLKILPSVNELKKKYLEFVNGKMINFDIDSSVIMFLDEEMRFFDRVNELIDRKELLKESNRQAEYLALQNQINPHFLYNALEAMRGDAQIHGLLSLANTAKALSTFFRYTISDMQFWVTVDAELSNINNYFLVQKYRFGDKLRMEVNFLDDENEIRRLRIPKLILQPIVENSVFHGLESKVERGTITITFDQTESHLLISIKDTGLGMPEKVVRKLNKSLNETPFKASKLEGDIRKKEHTGIALNNVSRRIKLFFGEEYGLYIFSTEGVGTNVKITLPRQELL